MKKLITLFILMVVFALLQGVFLTSLYYLGETNVFSFETIVYPFLGYTFILTGILFFLEPFLLMLLKYAK